jgi:hypothetical protein
VRYTLNGHQGHVENLGILDSWWVVDFLNIISRRCGLRHFLHIQDAIWEVFGTVFVFTIKKIPIKSCSEPALKNWKHKVARYTSDEGGEGLDTRLFWIYGNMYEFKECTSSNFPLITLASSDS